MRKIAIILGHMINNYWKPRVTDYKTVVANAKSEAVLSYPFTNEQIFSKSLKQLYEINNKKNFLFIVGGGAVVKFLPTLLENNDLKNTGIDLSARQLLNFEFICNKLNRALDKGISLVSRTDKNLSSPLSLFNRAKGAEVIPVEPLPKDAKINLLQGDILRYLYSVPEESAPDLIYMSNALDWMSREKRELLYGILRKDKFPDGTDIMSYNAFNAFGELSIFRKSGARFRKIA